MGDWEIDLTLKKTRPTKLFVIFLHYPYQSQRSLILITIQSSLAYLYQVPLFQEIYQQRPCTPTKNSYTFHGKNFTFLP